MFKSFTVHDTYLVLNAGGGLTSKVLPDYIPDIRISDLKINIKYHHLVHQQPVDQAQHLK